jgi:two-component system, OmpR family, response regulator
MRILVVEDEPVIAGALRAILEGVGHGVDVATTGGEALEWAGTFPYDLFVIDVGLPGIDGFTVCGRLREAGIGAPILMLTARDALEDRVAGLDAGADDYLPKPFAAAELLARVRALLRRGASDRPPIVRVGDLELDPATIADRFAARIDVLGALRER